MIKEEAAKDIEPNFWGSIVHCGWHDKVKLVLACGDHHQLQPVVTGSVEMNPCHEQLKHSYYQRAVEEGSEQNELLKQNRMHAAIADIPNETVYGGKVRNGPRCYRRLEVNIPGLREKALQPLYRGVGFLDGCADVMSDNPMRLHGFEIKGQVECSPVTKSRYNL